MTHPVVQFDQVTAGYRHNLVLRDVNLSIAAGELVGVLGPSGAGKTTLLRLLLGELAPIAGTVRCFSQPITAGRIRPATVGYVPQLEASERSFPLTVHGAVQLGLAATSRSTPWFNRSERAAVTAVLEQLGIAELHDRRLHELSGGQFQRVLLGRALVAKPKLLILDEPTSGIDMRTRAGMLNLLATIATNGVTVLLSTHDLNWVAAHLPRLVCLNRTVIADGPPSAVLQPDTLEQTFGAAFEVITHHGRPVAVDATSPVTLPMELRP